MLWVAVTVLGYFSWAWYSRHRQRQEQVPVSSLDTGSGTDTGLAVVKNPSATSFFDRVASIPYFMPYIPRDKGGLIGNLYGDEIFAPLVAEGGDLNVNNIVIPDFKVSYGDNEYKPLIQNKTRALSALPVVMQTEPAKPAMMTARQSHNTKNERKGWLW